MPGWQLRDPYPKKRKETKGCGRERGREGSEGHLRVERGADRLPAPVHSAGLGVLVLADPGAAVPA